MPLHAFARALDVGGPPAVPSASRAPQPTAQQARASSTPEATTSTETAPSGDPAQTPEAERQLAFLMGLIPGAKPSPDITELVQLSRKRPADASAETNSKRTATNTSSSAPTLRTQRKASRKGSRTLPQTVDDEGFIQPSRKHTAKAVVLAQQSAVHTGNRFAGLSNDASEPMDSQQQQQQQQQMKSPPPPPVVIKWTGDFREFREKVKSVVKGNVTFRSPGGEVAQRQPGSSAGADGRGSARPASQQLHSPLFEHRSQHPLPALTLHPQRASRMKSGP
ncbi:uncharacterized protein LOC126101477 [Schistocerca cancellata]|uniref:uncharacterized protein LOC126101477 n=1 Tax=Schistocerca cancellata TaxID=274614 RepID=UPI002118EDEC|nr:uncharacterized protein LOC126101477 [Schistocerca cancellata]